MPRKSLLQVLHHGIQSLSGEGDGSTESDGIEIVYNTQINEVVRSAHHGGITVSHLGGIKMSQGNDDNTSQEQNRMHQGPSTCVHTGSHAGLIRAKVEVLAVLVGFLRITWI